MLITSATTVSTVNYLSLYELKNYKKQFQSFWIPFMEQFIPATTIWVAGERWCNEPCTIINPCDYDFELVSADITTQEIPKGFFPKGILPRHGNPVVEPIKSGENFADATNPKASFERSSKQILPVQDLGLTTTQTIIKTTEEAAIDIAAYKSKFTQLEQIKEVA